MRKRVLAAILCAVCVMPAALAGASEAGAWGQIKRELTRPGGWRQIVTESPFRLGERAEIGKAGDVTVYEIGYGSYPSIDGSTVAVPMAMEFARQHLPLSESDLYGFVFLSTTHRAYEHLIRRQPNGSPLVPSFSAAMDEKHPVDLIIVTGPSEEELALARECGVELVKEPVCYDAFVFITHRDNPVNGLTVEQARKIYSGEITNWKEVGGEDEAIKAYTREPNSGSQTAMEALVMRGLPFGGTEPNYVVSSMEGLVSRVGNYENGPSSLGYTYLFYIDVLYPHEAVKTLAIDGVEPAAENIRSGAYPFSTNYYGVIRAGEEEGVAGQFLRWMVSEEGQRCVEQAGYIPMRTLQ
ncbi:MAG: substrate-binding domain-containing protein [Firmicutes bacterium]|nr:substrate-binding domain-containing protein [Bacillota bacterium]